ncbi:phosphatidylinositol-4-phosphate 5-kinase 7-like protein [Corchorus olitorius]|uniref:Phosphatidylinositol-4-phosphate 5-kinase 7-like protein n=1 Tax=Corchorus olitorius TaxID=93759 RepID=A0A1R3JLU3_9ROSI|nr:phosphatidylinositol-4-phosphate 5-kinase 7-like protein [Corchorus olitorius]
MEALKDQPPKKGRGKAKPKDQGPKALAKKKKVVAKIEVVEDDANDVEAPEAPTTPIETPAVQTNVEVDASGSKPPSKEDPSKRSVTARRKQEKNESLKTMAKYFDREYEDKDLKKELVNELLKFAWLNKNDIYKVAQHIIKDAVKFELYFALPEDLKEDFVKEQMNECIPYVPNFDFGAGN